MYKIGDKVVLQRNDPIGYVAGSIGTVAEVSLFILSGMPAFMIRVAFGNCHPEAPYCNGYPINKDCENGFWLKPFSVPATQETKSICQCPSFDLAWNGHNQGCVEKKK